MISLRQEAIFFDQKAKLVELTGLLDGNFFCQSSHQLEDEGYLLIELPYVPIFKSIPIQQLGLISIDDFEKKSFKVKVKVSKRDAAYLCMSQDKDVELEDFLSSFTDISKKNYHYLEVLSDNSSNEELSAHKLSLLSKLLP